jgi:hypothetical protein
VQVADIDAMLSEGIPFETIEERIGQMPLPDEAKALLWLYAWTWQPRKVQRRLLIEMAEALPITSH